MAKFKQHSDLREKLLQTGEAILVEQSPTDSFWGCGADGKGLNLLGQMARGFVFFVSALNLCLQLSNIRLALQEHNFDPSHPLLY